MALANRDCTILTFDPYVPPERDRYLRLVGPDERQQIRFRQAPAEEGPELDDTMPVDLVFLDVGYHTVEETTGAFLAWEAVVRPGGSIFFHDYSCEDWPGVAESVRQLGLVGETCGGTMFMWRKPA
jgi:hypothetical protein